MNNTCQYFIFLKMNTSITNIVTKSFRNILVILYEKNSLDTVTVVIIRMTMVIRSIKKFRKILIVVITNAVAGSLSVSNKDCIVRFNCLEY